MPLTTKDCTSITEGLRRIYFAKVRMGAVGLERRGEGRASWCGGGVPLSPHHVTHPCALVHCPLSSPVSQIRPLEEMYKFGHFFRCGVRFGCAAQRSAGLWRGWDDTFVWTVGSPAAAPPLPRSPPWPLRSPALSAARC